MPEKLFTKIESEKSLSQKVEEQILDAIINVQLRYVIEPEIACLAATNRTDEDLDFWKESMIL